MVEKKYNGAPFGTQTSRFDVSGVHPKIKMPGTYTQLPYDPKYMDDTTRSVGPGKYYIDKGGFSERAVKARSAGPGWAREQEVEKIAALPHLLFKDEWESRRLLRKKMGPGKYNVPDHLQTGYLKDCPKRGVCDTFADRFATVHQELFPGPGTYGKGGVPDTVFQEKQHEATSTIGLMESGGPAGFNPGGNNKVPGPGSYQFKSFTDAHAPDNRPSPFERYSYDRTKPLIEGHFAVLKNANLAPGQYEIDSSIEEWKTSYKKKHGKFSTLMRFPTWPSDRHSIMATAVCPKPKNQPGPGAYDPICFPEHEKSPNAPPFLTSSSRKGPAKSGNTVGAGRYDFQKWDDMRPIHGNGHTSLFKSKADVRPNLEITFSLKERLRGKDIKLEDRKYLVSPIPPPRVEQVRNYAAIDYAAQRAQTVI